ncbi:MAG TPA: flagellar protein FlgN [Chromobacteriaceae bacterium]|nr:flagellar protein FlgN [Chromobacteriaceae bacterium]
MNDVEQFVQLCHAESEQVGRLLAVLEDEQQLLIQGQVNRLESVADTKSQVLDDIARQAEHRTQLMQRLGLQDSDTVYIWLADKPEATEAWTRLEEILLRAQSVNQLNGRFIQERLGNVDEALTVLKEAAAATLGYGPDGTQPTINGGGRFLGSA